MDIFYLGLTVLFFLVSGALVSVFTRLGRS